MLRLLVVLSWCLSYMNIATSLSLYESCKSWLDGLKTESTKKAYSVHVSLFCRFHHTNPDELVRLKPEELKDMVTKYVLELDSDNNNLDVYLPNNQQTKLYWQLHYAV
jgi:hypothetical protein